MLPCGTPGKETSPSWLVRDSNRVRTFLAKLDLGCLALAFQRIMTSARSTGRPAKVLTTTVILVSFEAHKVTAVRAQNSSAAMGSARESRPLFRIHRL